MTAEEQGNLKVAARYVELYNSIRMVSEEPTVPRLGDSVAR